MADSFNVDDTLKEFGYTQKKSGSMAGYVILGLLLLIATGGALFLGKLFIDEKANSLKAEQTFNTMTRKMSEMETRNSELSSLLADKQSEMERLKDEWARQVTDMEADHKEQLERAFGQMNEIVYDTKKTLSYINDIETRLRKGQKVDKEEARKLAGVVNGLTFLHEQYKKPIAEFRELDRYFQRQLEAIPREKTVAPSVAVNRPNPEETTPVLKRILQNRQFREARDAYLEEKGRAQGVAEGVVQGRSEGKREAFVEAQRVVKQAYSRAQAQMETIALDNTKLLAQLDQLVTSNEQSAADVDEFFKTSREILKIHDQIMNIEPTKPTQLRP